MSRNRSRLFNSVMFTLFTCFMLAFAEKGYFNNGGSMNDAGDVEVHMMPSQKSGQPRCEEINIPMCRGTFDFR